MAYDIHAKGHHSITDFTEVHSRLESKIRMRYEAGSENKKAAEMEKYLRAIKMVTSNVNQTNQNSLESTLDDLAYDDLIELAQESLNIMNANGRSVSSIKQLFNREHKAFIKKGAVGDDIFEEELYSVLKAVEQKATKLPDIDLGVSLTGGQTTNTRNFAGLDKTVIDAYMEELFTELTQNQRWTQKAARTELARLKSVSGKVDLKGYRADIDFEAELDPKWAKMIQAFSGTNFTLKNYTSRSQIMEIHLGNTVPFKAFSGALDDLGFSQEESDHIFYHGLNSKNPAVGQHAYHTRLYYELTGVGLYDSDGNPLDSANYIIYNDPFTSDIFVRSTKQILYDLIMRGDTKFTGNPFKGGITLKKTYFI